MTHGIAARARARTCGRHAIILFRRRYQNSFVIPPGENNLELFHPIVPDLRWLRLLYPPVYRGFTYPIFLRELIEISSRKEMGDREREREQIFSFHFSSPIFRRALSLRDAKRDAAFVAYFPTFRLSRSLFLSLFCCSRCRILAKRCWLSFRREDLRTHFPLTNLYRCSFSCRYKRCAIFLPRNYVVAAIKTIRDYRNVGRVVLTRFRAR